MSELGTYENPIVYFDEDGGGPHEHVCARARNSQASTVRDWIVQQRITPSGLTAAEIALLERCAEDIE